MSAPLHIRCRRCGFLHLALSPAEAAARGMDAAAVLRARRCSACPSLEFDETGDEALVPAALPVAVIELPEPYAEIERWAVVRLRDVYEEPTRHVVGYVLSHSRLEAGEPYLGSPLRELDLDGRTARTRRGRRIHLVGEALPPGPLPRAIRAVLRRAEREWRLRLPAWDREL
jgi:hypothetical protein